MKFDKETILKVLALFDEEDIKYIRSDKLDILDEEDKKVLTKNRNGKKNIKGK